MGIENSGRLNVNIGLPVNKDVETSKASDNRSDIKSTDAKSQIPKNSENSGIPKSLMERSISRDSLESNDSGFEEPKESLFKDNQDILRGDLEGTPNAAASLEKFIKAATNFEDIRTFLSDDSTGAKEKQAFLLEKSGLLSHMTRENDPTNPKTVIFALEEMLGMLSQIASSSLPSDTRKDVLTQLLDDSGGPCFEARLSQGQAVFAQFYGIGSVENDNTIAMEDILDHEDSTDQILNAKCAKYMGACPDDLSEDGVILPEKFLAWVKEEDQVVGFSAANGEITVEVIKDFISQMIEAYVFEDWSS